MDKETKSNNPWTLVDTPTWNCCQAHENEKKKSEILYRIDSSLPDENKKTENLNKFKKYFQRLNRFTSIPRVHFFYDVVGFF